MKLWGKCATIAAAGALVMGLGAAPGSSQQTGTITGTVVDETSGRTLESAQVFLPALNMGGLSNQQGRFLLLNVPAGTHEIRVELIGYSSGTQQVTVAAGQAATVEFRLASTALRLQELVVTGVAGETPRVKLPFTVERVDFTDMPVPAPSADGLIKGKVPGAKVVSGSGQPGSDASIMLRGPTSIRETQEPLVIVDGVITDNTLADISSLDVESVEIVKGAAGASLYGSRAQNGVVQIRTKRGSNLRVDQSRITIRNEYGSQQIEGEIPLANTHPFVIDGSGNILDTDGNAVDLRDQSIAGGDMQLNGGGTPETAFQENPWPVAPINHLETFFNPGDFYSNYVAVEGRTGSTNYRASFENSKEEGVVNWEKSPSQCITEAAANSACRQMSTTTEGLSGFDRRQFRLNLDHEVRDNLNVSANVFVAKTKQEDTPNGVFFSLTFMGPHVDLLRRKPDGSLYLNPDPLSNEENPLYPIENRDLRDQRQRFMGSANVVWSPLSWFELEGNYSVDRADTHERNVTPINYLTTEVCTTPTSCTGETGSTPGGLFQRNDLSNDINASITASFNHAFGDLTTRTKVRYLLEDQHFERFDVTGDGLAVGGVVSFDNISGSTSAGSSISDVLSEGYFFITALDYQGKYVGDFLVRRDGSSLFGPEERWQTYYRGSGAWRLAQEAWWPFDNIDEFKLRYSLGTAGGRPRFSAQYETYNVSAGVITPQTLGNKFLKPEFSTEQEAGLELVLFNKVSAGLTYAWSEVEDQLINVPLAGFYGFNSQWKNAGTLKSNTVEAYVESAIVDRPNFGWNARVNFDRTRQLIDSLEVPAFRRGKAFFIKQGVPLGTFYGTVWASDCSQLPAGSDCSQFEVNDDGLLVYTGGAGYQNGIANSLWGTSGDGGNGTSYNWGRPIAITTEEDGSFNQIGNTTPTFNLSLSNTVRWGSLSLYGLLDGEFGADVYNQTRQWAYREWRSGDVDQAGKADGLKKPVAYYSDLYNTNASSSWFVEDGTYVKLREVSLRYTFDQETVESLFGSLGLDGMSVNLIGRNLLTFTDFQGYDPEVGASGTGGNALGATAVGRIDNFGYPNFRTFTASLELIF